MSATDDAASGARDATAPVDMDIKLFDRLLGEMGAHTDSEKAERLGKDRTTVWRWRKRKLKPSLDEAARVARFLNVSVEELFPVRSGGRDGR